MSSLMRTFWPRPLRAAIFDLDGVLADTHRHHFRAWRRVADELGFELDESVGEAVKGISRQVALGFVLRAGNITLTDADSTKLAAKKNDYYLQSVAHAGPEDLLLPDAKESLERLRRAGIRVALASASQNASGVLQATGIRPCFDAVVDGTMITNAKPNPDVFLRAASELGVEPGECVVIEDAAAGVDGARRAGCAVVGLGDPVLLAAADIVVHDLSAIPWSFIFTGKDLA